jgi:hypothetical protein
MIGDLHRCPICGSESRPDNGITLVFYGPVYYCPTCGQMFMVQSDSMDSVKNPIGSGRHLRTPYPDWAVLDKSRSKP